MTDGSWGRIINLMTQPQDGAPLIVTLGLDAGASAFFEALRRAHFPAERNFLSAHLTLFHRLPAAALPEIRQGLDELSQRAGRCRLEVTGARSIGRGVAFTIRSDQLRRLRDWMAKWWHAWLVPQDRQGFWPHVSVQNKVRPEQADELLRQLGAAFVPFAAQGERLLLWRYRNGPWEALGRYELRTG
jgi:2'-5' RNA ligase